MQASERAKKMLFLSLVTLTFDLDLQTCPSEGPNTSSVWIWHKSVPEIFHTLTKKPQTDGTRNRTFHSSLHAVKVMFCVCVCIWPGWQLCWSTYCPVLECWPSRWHCVCIKSGLSSFSVLSLGQSLAFHVRVWCEVCRMRLYAMFRSAILLSAVSQDWLHGRHGRTVSSDHLGFLF